MSLNVEISLMIVSEIGAKARIIIPRFIRRMAFPISPPILFRIMYPIHNEKTMRTISKITLIDSIYLFI